MSNLFAASSAICLPIGPAPVAPREATRHASLEAVMAPQKNISNTASLCDSHASRDGVNPCFSL